MEKQTNKKQNHYEIDREKFFETDERKAIMKTTEDRSLADRAKGRLTWQVRWILVHLALYSGLRVSEIAALKVCMVHLDSKEPFIKVYRGKGKKSRDVYIDSELAQHLRDFIHFKRRWNQSVELNAPLFAGRGGKQYTTNALSLSFKEAVKAAGLRTNLSIHSARHSYATFLYHGEKDLRAVQKQLGHSNVAMTTLYSDIMPEERSRIANSILYDKEDKVVRLIRTRPPNTPSVGRRRLRNAVKELNKTLGLEPPIDTNAKNEKLIKQLSEAAKLIVWESEGDFGADDITEETKATLDDFVNIK